MRLICTNNNLDLGIIKRNTIKTVYFDIFNNSDKIYTIDILNGCGCTNSSLEENPILSFSHTRLKVEFDPNKNALGVWTKSINLTYYNLDLNEEETITLNFIVNVTV